MILALATGWTPDVIGDLPVPFHVACHWTLYVQSLVGVEGLAPIAGSGLEAGTARADRLRLNASLYPDA